MVVNKLANMVADMEVDMVADMEVDKVSGMEVDKVANIVAVVICVGRLEHPNGVKDEVKQARRAQSRRAQRAHRLLVQV